MKEPINIPIDMEVKVKATLNLTNTETGEVQTMSIGAPEGMILNHYLDWAVERGMGLLGETTFNRCYLGTGNAPVQPTDTGLSGSQLAMSSSGVTTKDLTDVGVKLELLGSIDGLGISSPGGLAITPDEEILLVGRGDDLRAFHINKNDWTLTPIQVDAFVGLSGIRALCIKNELLFVGIGQAPWGKLYKRVGNSFEFFADLPGLSERPTKVDITYDDKYLMLRSPFKLFSIEEDEIIEVDTSVVGTTPPGITFAEGRHDVFRGFVYSNYSFRVDMYSIIDHVLVFQESFIVPTRSENRLVEVVGLYAAGESIYVCGRTFESVGAGGRYYCCTGRLFLSEDGWKVSSGTFETSNFGEYNVSGVAAIKKTLIFTLGKFGVAMTTNPGIFYEQPGFIGIDTTIDSSWVWLDSEQVLLIRDPSSDGSPSNLKIIKVRESITSSQSYARKWTFPAGTGTGVVNEIAVQATSGTGSAGNNRYFLRFVLPEGFEKTDLHQLEVEVEAEVENPGVWEGVIPGGSRDGSDVSYRITMSENQFRNFIRTGYNNLSTWFGTSGTPSVRIGTSNEDTDLVLDRENIRGEEIEYISSTAIREAIPYVPGSLERTIRLFLEIDQGNGKIGEIVFGSRFCRVTFDPPLIKYDPEGVDAGRDPSMRLYMNLVFGWKREGE